MTGATAGQRGAPAWTVGRAGTLAAVSGALWWLAFPGVGPWWVGLFALAPFLVALERVATWRRALATGLVFGGVFYGLSLTWLAEVHWAVPIPATALEMAHAGFLGVAMWWALRAWPRTPRFLLVPVVWTGCDVIRGLGSYGFPWYRPAEILPLDLELVQAADVVGAIGLSFLLSSQTGLLVDAWRLARASGREGRRLGVVVTLGAVALGAAALVGSSYGRERPDELRTFLAEGPGVLVVQANIAQELKNEAGPRGNHQPERDPARRLEAILQRHIRLSLDMLHRAPDLVIWGETMYPQDLSHRRNAPHAERVADLVEKMQASFLIGGFRFESDEQARGGLRLYNTAFYFEPASRREVHYLSDAGFKRHLVPGGETIPLGSVPGVRALVSRVLGSEPTHLDPGAEPIRFTLDTRDGRRLPFGVFICYETYFPGLLRPLVAADEPGDGGWGGATFLVHMSNEGWFGDSAELDQHLAMAQLRAIEVRRSVVRATNTGVTAWIDPLGRIIDRLVTPDGRDRDIEGVLFVEPTLCMAETTYLAYGKSYPWCVCVLMLLLLVTPRVRGGLGRAPGEPQS